MRLLPGFLSIFAAFNLAGGAIASEPAVQSGGPVMLSTAFTPESLRESRLAEFETLLDEAALTNDFVGLAVAVVSGDEVLLLKTYGVREIGGAEPVTAETIFRLASVSKGFASGLAGRAVEEGKFAWSTPVSAFAPKFSLRGGAENTVTIEHLLSHRVGLPPNAYDNLLESGMDVDAILPRFRSVAPICRVGACYAYQNISYNLVSNVLESVYGETYPDLVRRQIFQPLGMTTASFGAEGLSTTGNWARPHVRDRIKGIPAAWEPWRIAEIDDAYYRTPAAGGVNASIADMALWLSAQLGHAPDVLPQTVLEQVHKPLVQTRAETRRWRSLAARISDTHYGLGWRIYDYAGHTLVNHSGGVEGYGAQIAMLPEQDIGIVILSNTRAKRVWRILPTFLDIELGLPEMDWLELAEEEGAGGEAPVLDDILTSGD